MTTQADLFASSPRPKKAGRVVATSVIAYQERPRDGRVNEVVEWLKWAQGRGAMPTSAELASMAPAAHIATGTEGPIFTERYSELMHVRRGLSDALALGLVEHAGQRKCAVSGRQCVTWALRSR